MNEILIKLYLYVCKIYVYTQSAYVCTYALSIHLLISFYIERVRVYLESVYLSSSLSTYPSMTEYVQWTLEQLRSYPCTVENLSITFDPLET